MSRRREAAEPFAVVVQGDWLVVEQDLPSIVHGEPVPAGSGVLRRLRSVARLPEPAGRYRMWIPVERVGGPQAVGSFRAYLDQEVARQPAPRGPSWLSRFGLEFLEFITSDGPGSIFTVILGVPLGVLAAVSGALMLLSPPDSGGGQVTGLVFLAGGVVLTVWAPVHGRRQAIRERRDLVRAHQWTVLRAVLTHVNGAPPPTAAAATPL